ncbi:MAG: hypothetical protein KBE22_00585 [Candidatus Accumulibacter sp.]|nr:hypothetical protein [Accumulibacter sp.]
MADRPDPYVRKDPNDIIRSGDWNELQVQTREDILKHTHTGKNDGRLIPGKAIDPTAEVSVKTLTTSGNLTVGGELKVNGKALLGDIADLLATVKGLQDEKLNRAGDTVNGNLSIQKGLLVGGNVGIGTSEADTKLEVIGGAHISNGSGFAVQAKYMASGSLTLGGRSSSFGDGWGWNANTAALMLETKAKTEIAVNDGNVRLASLMHYQGGSAPPRITIGRDMGWETTPVRVAGSLDVAGEIVRKVSMATGLGPSDPTDNGQIVSRVLTFTKLYADTAIRIIWCDNIRVRGNDTAARWEIKVDGQAPPGGAIFQDKYSICDGGVTVTDRHDPTTIVGYAVGVPPGVHTIGVWVGPVLPYSCEAYTGWQSSRWTLEAQEVWI